MGSEQFGLFYEHSILPPTGSFADGNRLVTHMHNTAFPHSSLKFPTRDPANYLAKNPNSTQRPPGNFNSIKTPTNSPN